MKPDYWRQLTGEWAAALLAKNRGGDFERELRARLNLENALKKEAASEAPHRQEDTQSL